MGGSQKTAKQGNAIAAASLKEQKRQYSEQKAKEKKKEEAAQSNAMNVRTSANRAYSNSLHQSTDFSVNPEGSYNVLTAGGTPSLINTMLSDNNLYRQDTLG